MASGLLYVVSMLLCGALGFIMFEVYNKERLLSARVDRFGNRLQSTQVDGVEVLVEEENVPMFGNWLDWHLPTLIILMLIPGVNSVLAVIAVGLLILSTIL